MHYGDVQKVGRSGRSDSGDVRPGFVHHWQARLDDRAARSAAEIVRKVVHERVVASYKWAVSLGHPFVAVEEVVPESVQLNVSAFPRAHCMNIQQGHPAVESEPLPEVAVCNEGAQPRGRIARKPVFCTG